MVKEYILFEGAGRASCSVSEDEYNKAKDSRTVVGTAFKIEKLFSLTARSYIELETALMSASLEWSLENTSFEGNQDFFDEWNEVINLKLLSLLTAASAYTEKMESISKNGIVPGFDWETYDPRRVGVFDADFCYRLMCALRNFSIHDELPISGFPVALRNESPSGRLSDNEPWRQRRTCSPVILSKPLLHSKNLRKKTQDELEALGVEGVDLKMFSRGYLESLYALHSIVRDLTDEALKAALKFLSEMEDKLSDAKGDQCKFAHIREEGADIHSAEYIDTSRLSRILIKRKDWSKLARLRRIYFSSETTLRNGVYLGEVDKIWINR